MRADLVVDHRRWGRKEIGVEAVVITHERKWFFLRKSACDSRCANDLSQELKLKDSKDAIRIIKIYLDMRFRISSCIQPDEAWQWCYDSILDVVDFDIVRSSAVRRVDHEVRQRIPAEKRVLNELSNQRNFESRSQGFYLADLDKLEQVRAVCFRGHAGTGESLGSVNPVVRDAGLRRVTRLVPDLRQICIPREGYCRVGVRPHDRNLVRIGAGTRSIRVAGQREGLINVVYEVVGGPRTGKRWTNACGSTPLDKDVEVISRLGSNNESTRLSCCDPCVRLLAELRSVCGVDAEGIRCCIFD